MKFYICLWSVVSPLVLLLVQISLLHQTGATASYSSSGEPDDTAVDTNDDEDDVCGLYLAVSSASSVDEPKWGVYTGVTIPSRTLIGPPELAIQTHNLIGNARSAKGDNVDENSAKQAEKLRIRAVQFFEEFIWVADTTGGKRELDEGRIVSALAGAGFLGGYNPKLTNADWDHRGAYFKDHVEDHFSLNGGTDATPVAVVLGTDGHVVEGATQQPLAHPGRGASSHFYNVTLRSKEEISAGSEIFLDYGESWGGDDDEESELNKKDFEKVDQLVDQMIEFFDKYDGELTNVAKSEIYEFLIRDIVNAAAGPDKGKAIHLLLPKNADGLREVKEAGGTLKYSQPSSRRDLAWLKRNGKCMDNLIMGPSTIPHAGRGAFAKRKIHAGRLVSPAPLVHIPDKTILDMHEITFSVNDDGNKVYHRANDIVIGQQLLLNYCYGHPESSMLFFPAGSMTSFINHSAEKPNAKMQFSSHKMHEKDWFQVPPHKLLDSDHSYLGLMMEIVALRDIEKGEEVLLDYGPEWQTAWDAHVQKWNAGIQRGDIPNPWPIRALDLSREYKTKPFKTVSEGAAYPTNIRQMCFLVVKNDPEKPDSKTWAIPKSEKIYDDDHLFDCKVIERIELEEQSPLVSGGAGGTVGLAYNYTIEWYDGEDADDKGGTQVSNVPHQAIVFVDKPLTSDQFVSQAFRHEIGIPNDVFPQGPWRNLISDANEIEDEQK